MDASNIYLDFMGIVPGAISNISLVLEHREKNAHLRVEYLKGDSWLHQCSLAAAAKDTRDECVIKLEDIEDFYKIPLKVRVLRSGNDASESLDQAYLEVEYCPTSMNCGDGVIGTGEECDDGNLLNGDGCSEFCTREILMCGNWGACVEGKQTQTCFYGDSVRVNVRGCGNVFFFENFLIILLIVLLALLILFFLFFPAFYMAARKRKEEERRKRE
ncbi:DUF4215 domain-containing protein [Candidatus Woesearchaeota archaeon]|nr:DUF4215 domain-containing protein [Candidatus Woesearchaeota archaeon]